MRTELVTIIAGGRRYSAWESVQITAALGEACRTFQVETTEHPGEFSFPPGTPVEVKAGADLVVSGYVNRYTANGAATVHRIRIEGRSKGQDAVDCAAVHPKGYAKDKSPVQFAKEMDHFGIGITDRLGLQKVPMQQIYQGERLHDCLERYCRQQGGSMMGRADGGIDVTNASVAQRAAGELREGVNILEWSVSFDDQDRHSDYTVKAQNRHGSGEANLRIKEQERDAGVRRYRPKMLLLEGDGDKRRARERARYERERCAGRGTCASVTVVGWRDDAGRLWEPNTIIHVSAPILMHLEQDMLIEKVTFSQDDNKGTLAKLELVDPRAHRGKGNDGKKSAGAWNAGMGQ